MYRHKKKIIKHDKYYNELCEKGLKKRYRSIPIEDRLPIGILESEDTEEDGHKTVNNAHEFEVENHVVKVDDCEAEDHNENTVTFDSILVPIQESLPYDSNNVVSVVKSKEAIIKARVERNDALLLARHYRDVAEALKSENKLLQEEMDGRINDVKKQAAIY